MDNFILFQDGFLLFLDGYYYIENKFAILVILVTIAAVFDATSHRIPNWLVFFGAVCGIAYNGFSAYGIGAMLSLGGIAVGMGTFMPLYLLRAMGAGDVKLIGMVGAFLGPASTLGAVLTVFIAGGVLAIAAAIRNRATSALLGNFRFIMIGFTLKAMTGSVMRVDAPHVSAGKVPYALAIAAGTVVHIFLLRSGHALLS